MRAQIVGNRWMDASELILAQRSPLVGRGGYVGERGGGQKLTRQHMTQSPYTLKVLLCTLLWALQRHRLRSNSLDPSNPRDLDGGRRWGVN